MDLKLALPINQDLQKNNLYELALIFKIVYSKRLDSFQISCE